MRKNEDKSRGLYGKYMISKTNGEPIDERSEYFVLRLDYNGKDKKHIESCRKSILLYAEEIKDHLPQLSKDIIKKYGK